MQVLKLGGFVENLLHVAVRQEQQLRGSGECCRVGSMRRRGDLSKNWNAPYCKGVEGQQEKHKADKHKRQQKKKKATEKEKDKW